MRLTIEINHTFKAGDRDWEIERLLKNIAREIKKTRGPWDGMSCELNDRFGNKCGEFDFLGDGER